MLKTTTVVFVIVLVSIAAGWLLSIGRILPVLQPITVCLSIMAAAVFVRLNRGMPTLDWKSIPPNDRKNLTSAIEALSLEYVWVLVIASISVAILLVIASIGATDLRCLNPWLGRLLVGGFIASLMLTVWRMSYVVWRDYDIVRLQKTLIDEEADRQTKAENIAEADKKLKGMQGAQLKAPPSPPVKQWDE